MIIHSDCILAMSEMEPSSIDAIVTDPPYGLEFMGAEWDKFGGKRNRSKAIQGSSFEPLCGEGRGVPRVVRGQRRKCRICGKWSGGTPNMLCTCDSPEWIPSNYGAEMQEWHRAWASEALRVLKPGGSLLSFGGTRTFHRLTCGLEDSGFTIKDCLMYLYGQGFPKSQDLGKMIDKRLGVEREVVGELTYANGTKSRKTATGSCFTPDEELNPTMATAPASDLARHWDGYKIGGIKPSWEPIIWAVKPPEGAWIDNVLKYGTGAVNVDECRIPFLTEADAWDPTSADDIRGGNLINQENKRHPTLVKENNPKGRFPANLLLDEEAARLLDEQSGVLTSGGGVKANTKLTRESQCIPSNVETVFTQDAGGASRFFYTSKATDRQDYNDHPTLKPTDLIEWLIRLVTRPGQTVLDPFAGSGTTGVAAIQSGREFILIEQDEHYISICERRTSDGAQQGMF